MENDYENDDNAMENENDDNVMENDFGNENDFFFFLLFFVTHSILFLFS
jgi:hypothetical protein